MYVFIFNNYELRCFISDFECHFFSFSEPKVTQVRSHPKGFLLSRWQHPGFMTINLAHADILEAIILSIQKYSFPFSPTSQSVYYLASKVLRLIWGNHFFSFLLGISRENGIPRTILAGSNTASLILRTHVGYYCEFLDVRISFFFCSIWAVYDLSRQRMHYPTDLLTVLELQDRVIDEFLCSSGMSYSGFWSSKIVKDSVGHGYR